MIKTYIMMNPKRIFYSIIFVLGLILTSEKAYSQVDTAWIETTVEIEIYQSMIDMNHIKPTKHYPLEVADFVKNCKIQMSFLKSNLPEKYVCIKVFTKDVKACSNIFMVQNGKEYTYDDRFDYHVLAINSHNLQVYRLYGFLNNDFEHLADDLKASYLRYGEQPLIKQNRQLAKKFYIEEVDLDCLYKASKANVKNPDKYPCLEHGVRTNIVD